MAAPPAKPHTRVTMVTNRHIPHRHSLLLILWGLVLAKCFVFEYLVQIYDVPVNSALYVWSLSLFMAAAATFVFVRVRGGEGAERPGWRPATVLWAVCLLVALLVLATAFTLKVPEPARIPALLAALLGLGYAGNGLLEKRAAHLLSAGAWWLGALFLFSMDAPENLRAFGSLLLIASVLPALWLMIRRRRELQSLIEEAKHAGD